ncbi:uncharacterized protein K444DRAFT_710060, partial [Hyaloscypha bicolor E]
DPNCTNVVIPVSITAKNALVPIEFTLVSSFNIVARLVNHPFASLLRANYNIAGTFCEPAIDVPKKRNNIHFLAHPAAYDRTYESSD